MSLLTTGEISALRKEAIVHCGETNPDEISKTICNPLKSPCLFNLREDPCERINLATQRPLIVSSLENALMKYKKSQVKPQNTPEDPNADPRKWNNTWVAWQDADVVITTPINDWPLTPTGIAVLVVLVVLFLIVVAILIVLSFKTKVKKVSSNSDIFPTDDTLDAPTSVVHVKTESKNEKDSFEHNERSRQNSFRNVPKSIE